MALCLQKAEVLAAMGDSHQACLICQDTVGLSCAAGCDVQPHANTAQVKCSTHAFPHLCFLRIITCHHHNA